MTKCCQNCVNFTPEPQKGKEKLTYGSCKEWPKAVVHIHVGQACKKFKDKELK